ncbi:hypothetical protein LINPERPRIM_LOCUS40396, partial [Linum perenne]
PLSQPLVYQDQKTKKTLGIGRKSGRNFFLQAFSTKSDDVSCTNLSSFSANASIRQWDLWHSRLGHPHSA